MARHGLLVAVDNRPVMLFKVTQALADINSGVDYVDIVRRPPHVEIFLESELADVDAIGKQLKATYGNAIDAIIDAEISEGRTK